MSSDPSVFILIPVHNRKATTLACLAALQQTGDLARYQVVVLDDGSTDGTAAAIAAQFPAVKILTGDGNWWWTGAIAHGMQYAADQNADFVIWLNDDCQPRDQALPTLVAFMQAHPGVIAAPACYLAATGQPVENGCRQRQRLTAAPGAVLPVESVSGYCVGLSARVWRTIGYPDPRRFPHYSGDDMYTLRASRHGLPVYLVGDAVVQLHGMREAEHTFRAYVRSRFGERPTWQQVFGQQKSRYYLPSQYFYHTTKYGLSGALLFSFKLGGWLWQYGQLRWRPKG